ncbi:MULTISPECIES: hypothetical protein [Lactobacillaceae]|uniref:Uncharacterized protein n=1 Tax=Lentilactobacillus kefiri TaxID=33962 RepID=A0A511E223_LENKE|nr:MULTISPECIES: hypothetical protein [Lactobacillaceae]NRN94571.1 hypothetical protein [Lactobacillus helveticus]NRO48721.1 hypothetical protein [Lactobacillus helveticus]GEL29478.1 hypothetical protein LKE01_22980 [Lentilactobacillus kefiri]
MSKPIFDPVISVFVKGDSKIHENGIFYKVSYGYENENDNPIFKIQMAYNRRVKGRQAPSYTTNDFKLLAKLQPVLKAKFDDMDKRLRRIVYIYDLDNNSLRPEDSK